MARMTPVPELFFLGGTKEAFGRQQPSGGTQEARSHRTQEARGNLEAKVFKSYVFYSRKSRDRVFRVDETSASVTKYRFLHDNSAVYGGAPR